VTTPGDRLPNDVWLVIPARGGSKGIPGKNLRLLAGRPLLGHTLDRLAGWSPVGRTIVSTDDDQIAAVARGRATIHDRSAQLAEDRATLDEVVAEVAVWLRDQGASDSDIVLTLQPTSPFLRRATILRAATLIRDGAASVLTVTDDRYLRWGRDDQGQPVPLFAERANRQWLPETWAETGGVIGARLGGILERGSRIQAPVALLDLDPVEGLDIDDYADWAVAEYYAGRRSVVIRADASREWGMGHVYRAMALANELASHSVVIATRCDGPFALGAEFLARTPYRVHRLRDNGEFVDFCWDARPDIAILDVLDTNEDFVEAVARSSGFVVSFEDLGPGARRADLVINDLYTDLLPAENHWYGVEHAVLAPAFERATPRADCEEAVERVLITFGGTDPANLTVRGLEGLGRLGFAGRVTVVLGPGYAHAEPDLRGHHLEGEVLRDVANMAEVMCSADLALTSGGRTVTELMSVGVPTVVMCQNMRELRHTHASSPFGVMNLGLGELVDIETLAQYLAILIARPELRRDMRRRGLDAVRGRSNQRIAERLLEAARDRGAHSGGAR
jgi:spore coat polysaccharide biosynthesis predicted glycosyltransferase SpsG/CMP-N-acetylneuraminic acid synthetase